MVFALQKVIQTAMVPWGVKTGSSYIRFCKMCLGHKSSLKSFPASHAKLSTLAQSRDIQKGKVPYSYSHKQSWERELLLHHLMVCTKVN